MFLSLAGCAATETVEPAQRTWTRDAAGVADTAGGHAPPYSTNLPDLPRNTQLIGLEGGMVEKLFGRPTLARRDQPAEYWRYNFDGCIIDIYLYRGNADAARRVKHVELRSAFDGIQKDPCRKLRELTSSGERLPEDPELTLH